MAEQPKSNILKALEGLPVTTNQPKSRILQAIEDGGSGGGGGSYDDSELRRRIEALENQKPQTFIAAYQSTTAQDIIAFLATNPHAAVLVQNGDGVYSAIFSKILAENKVILRVIASLQSKFNIFEYTITNSSWRATTTPLYYDDTNIKALIDKNSGDIDRIADYVGVELGVEYLPLAKNQGVIIEDHIGIHTGLTMNGNAIFRFKGCLKDSNHMACLIGARVGTNTSERTCINVLPKSKKVQSQWANNAEQIIDMNFLQPFDIIADKAQTIIAQNGVEMAIIQNGGFDGVNETTPICIFNQQLSNNNYYSPILQSAEIEINGQTTTIEPMIKRNLETGAESVVLLKNGVEMAIDGLTLFEIQAA